MNSIARRRGGRVRSLFRHEGKLGRLTVVLATRGSTLCRGLMGSVNRANTGFRK